MVTIKPTIKVYDSEGDITRVYHKAVDKMIDKTYDIDLEQFDFDEVAKGKCKELDNLVTKLCKESGLGSDVVNYMLLERFVDEYDMDYDVFYVYGLDEPEDLNESKKSLKEMKIDDKKLFKIFKEKYEELSIFTKKDFEEYREYLYWFDKLIDTEYEFNKLAHKFENDVKDAFSNRYCLAFMFALEDLGLLNAIENGKIEESKKSSRKSIKEKRYNVELSDYTGLIVDEDTFDKKSDAIQWANDNGRNCYARIWDNEEGKTVKEWKVKSIKESTRKSLKEMFDNEGIVDDFVDFLIYDCGYDKKTVEKYFYKKYKLNSLDTISTKLYIKIKNEIEDALGYNDIM